MIELQKIEPSENVSLVDRIEQQIILYIKENDLRPGDSLPKEMELAEQLGVSRTAVREAMLRLRTLGLIESKRHKGMVLKEPNLIENLEKMLDPHMLDKATLHNLFEFRLMFEIGMTDFVFARKTQEQIQTLEQIVNKTRDVQCDSNSFSLEDEVLFHKSLYKIADNEMLLRFQKIILPVFEYVHHLQREELNGALTNGTLEDEISIVTHRDLVEELKNGTPQSFREAMRQHLQPHFSRILRSKC
ncbi:FadR/GntR family transcriptional regulator [Capnocytophaga canis]|uniref:Putative GntR family regulatory protein n=1 Tax=Capnocytophaga canis TaxID=1848903 RepID=A0A0B7IT75_9FLAO|nr:FadR/GntR family transcriptional regulator [Capnocytophaga canis]CEN53804.1 putative GntR family regulatory protein [Capnocytophaga canis]